MIAGMTSFKAPSTSCSFELWFSGPRRLVYPFTHLRLTIDRPITFVGMLLLLNDRSQAEGPNGTI